MHTLRTAELELAPMTVALMRALHDGRRQDAERELQARIPEAWGLPPAVLRARIAQLEADASAASWLLHAVIRTHDRQLVGNVGFHGPPGPHPLEATWPAVVELGYTIAEGLRRKGYATQACAALLDWARGQAARHVVVSIAKDNAASLRVAGKLGFVFARELEHPQRGVERLHVLRLRSTPDHVATVRAQFERQAQAYADTAQASDEAAHAALVELCAPGPDARVLDVACGPGALTRAFAARCAHAVGLDATAAMLEIARRNAAARDVSNVRFEQGDATALPFADESFDLAVCRAAFHHFPEPGRVLAEMRRVVRPGGKVVVADFASSDDPEEAARHDAIERLCDPSHARALTRDELRGLYRAQGLEVAVDLPRRMHYELDEWLAHGGPPPAEEAQLRRLFAEALIDDRTGLAVRREDGRVRFTHQTLLLIGLRPSA